MRPDIDPGSGEVVVLLLLAIIACSVWAWHQFRSEP